ncbi:MAG: molybdenum cofactor guanylyltransferase [Gallionellaceae bacterium]|jgi:molybdopterin-guanine dinucleotide biosynthesis protein A
MIADCTALILAGGESRRMGRDKANLVLDGQTLLQSVAAKMSPLFAEVIVSVRQPRPEIALAQVCDDAAYVGPLAGLAAGLERMHTPWLFAVACDMPFISPGLVEYLAGQRTDFQAVVPMVRGYPQPLAAFYAASTLLAVRDTLNGRGKHSLRALLEGLRVRYINESEMLEVDPGLASFFDLDTPQEYAQATSRVLPRNI